MFYYKVLDEQENILGVVNSLHLRYYNPNSKKILCCDEKKAQYVRLDDEHLYHVYWFQPECEEMKGKYPDAQLHMSTEEEYENYIAEMAKVESEQK